ncbi:MAG: NADH-quinone oxidoreductase subunit F [Magnetovibrio sp.]|nr:NADH-quinone oxidoreductase subunit F [Magnetovibrio sp.]
MKIISSNKKRKKASSFSPKGRQPDDTAVQTIQSIIGRESRKREFLIENLHRIQDAFGFISTTHLAALALEMGLSQSEVYEVATFYHHFDVMDENADPPPELTVRICVGITCEMKGAKMLLRTLPTMLGKNTRVLSAPCVGACDRAPVAVVKRRQVFQADKHSILKAVKNNLTEPEIPNYPNLETYRKRGGYQAFLACINGKRSRENIIETVENSGLRGLGGAGFPTARKWTFMKNAPKPRLVAINADEGEPGTFKDRMCIETDPHRFLEGVLITSWAIEADRAYIYLRDEYPHCREILTQEINALEEGGLLSYTKLHLRRGAGAYICGEESAMLESIEGKRGLPRNRPPFPAQAGLWGNPTLINNVETMYWVTEIVNQGAYWYKDQGTPHYYSVSGRVKRPGVVLAPSGISARQLIDDYCDGMEDGHTFFAYLPGGASGGVLPAKLADVPLDFGSLDEYGCFIGSSAVVVFSEKDNIKNICKNLLHFFEDESCGQCTPCRVGCEKMLAMMEEPEWNESLMIELADVMNDASICGLGQAAPNPIRSAFRFFRKEL